LSRGVKSHVKFLEKDQKMGELKDRTEKRKLRFSEWEPKEDIIRWRDSETEVKTRFSSVRVWGGSQRKHEHRGEEGVKR